MSSSYIPKDVYTICTFQTDAEPRHLIPTRSPITVFYGADKTRPLLTIEDRNIDVQFPCKSPKNTMWSFLCFGAGIIVGAALVLSGPVGWAVIAIGVGVMAIGAYQATKISHKCTGSLGAGSWKIEHQTVNFDSYKAITQNSILMCDAGGLLTPIFSYAVAKKYAQQIDRNNSKEIAFNSVAAFFGGAGFVIAAAEMGIAKTVAWMGGTMLAMNEATYWEREIIRDNSLETNEHYQDMNSIDENSRIPGYVKDVKGATPGDLGSPDILEVDGKTGWLAKDPTTNKLIVMFNGKQYIKDIQGNYTELKQGSSLANDLKKIQGINPRELYKNADAKQIVENIRQGKYSDALIKSSRDGNQIVRPRDLNKVLPDLKTIKVNNIKNLGKLGIKGGGFIAFFFPFSRYSFSHRNPSRTHRLSAQVAVIPS